MRLKDKVAVVIGAGQSPGPAVGNGRATVIRFAEEGAAIMAVDRDLDSATETLEIAARTSSVDSFAFRADVTVESEIASAIKAAHAKWGRIDILHYNVGVSMRAGDADPLSITTEAFDRIFAINLRGAVVAGKYVLPIMRSQKSGCIIHISSSAARQPYPYVAYRASKAAMIAYIKQVAVQNGEYNIRANVILPGLIDTPMAIDTRMELFGKSREQVKTERNAVVPLRRQMGTGWDVAAAAVFLASDEASFITGIEFNVDGGELSR